MTYLLNLFVKSKYSVPGLSFNMFQPLLTPNFCLQIQSICCLHFRPNKLSSPCQLSTSYKTVVVYKNVFIDQLLLSLKERTYRESALKNTILQEKEIFKKVIQKCFVYYLDHTKPWIQQARMWNTQIDQLRQTLYERKRNTISTCISLLALLSRRSWREHSSNDPCCRGEQFLWWFRFS